MGIDLDATPQYDQASYPQHPELPDLPTYDQLPFVPVPSLRESQRCAWGLWDHLGVTSTPDQLGTLNLLTPTVVKAAGREIVAGISVAINWSMDNCQTPHSNRRKPEHRIFTLRQGGGEWTGHDDEVAFNTQGGSQWDGFREPFLRALGVHRRMSADPSVFHQDIGHINLRDCCITGYPMKMSWMKMLLKGTVSTVSTD